MYEKPIKMLQLIELLLSIGVLVAMTARITLNFAQKRAEKALPEFDDLDALDDLADLDDLFD